LPVVAVAIGAVIALTVLRRSSGVAESAAGEQKAGEFAVA